MDDGSLLIRVDFFHSNNSRDGSTTGINEHTLFCLNLFFLFSFRCFWWWTHWCQLNINNHSLYLSLSLGNGDIAARCLFYAVTTKRSVCWLCCRAYHHMTRVARIPFIFFIPMWKQHPRKDGGKRERESGKNSTSSDIPSLRAGLEAKIDWLWGVKQQQRHHRYHQAIATISTINITIIIIAARGRPSQRNRYWIPPFTQSSLESTLNELPAVERYGLTQPNTELLNWVAKHPYWFVGRLLSLDQTWTMPRRKSCSKVGSDHRVTIVRLSFVTNYSFDTASVL